jgi:hypothetical protein
MTSPAMKKFQEVIQTDERNAGIESDKVVQKSNRRYEE